MDSLSYEGKHRKSVLHQGLQRFDSCRIFVPLYLLAGSSSATPNKLACGMVACSATTVSRPATIAKRFGGAWSIGRPDGVVTAVVTIEPAPLRLRKDLIA
jgi:hypothetical protein